MVTINVCIGSACHLKGSYNVIHGLQNIIKEKELDDKVVVKAAFCLGQCTHAVSVRVDDENVVSVSEETVETFFQENVIGRL